MVVEQKLERRGAFKIIGDLASLGVAGMSIGGIAYFTGICDALAPRIRDYIDERSLNLPNTPEGERARMLYELYREEIKKGKMEQKYKILGIFPSLRQGEIKLSQALQTRTLEGGLMTGVPEQLAPKKDKPFTWPMEIEDLEVDPRTLNIMAYRRWAANEFNIGGFEGRRIGINMISTRGYNNPDEVVEYIKVKG